MRCVKIISFALILGFVLPIRGFAQSEMEVIQRGAYVARAADCTGCHTNAGEKPFAGDFILASPLGNIIATNITPSKQYGIGNWNEEQFAKAIRQGISPTRYLYPAMPYTAYAELSDADVHALYLYFMKVVKPVDNKPERITSLDFPFNQRWLMMGWNMIFARKQPWEKAPPEQDNIKQGEYLVKVLEHCSTCHTPRNILMGEKESQFLGGGFFAGWYVPNITSDPISGIGRWSNDELVSYLRSGTAHWKSQAAGSMAESIENSLRHLSGQDLQAIAAYLKTVPPIRTHGQIRPAFSFTEAKPVNMALLDYAIDRNPNAMTDKTTTDGQTLYVAACATCHQLDGQGTKDQFYPSLTANSATGGMFYNNTVMVILNGIQRKTNDGIVFMPSFGNEMNDIQIANLANYIFERFGNDSLKVTAEQVKLLRLGGERPIIAKIVLPIGGVILLTVVGIIYIKRKRRRQRYRHLSSKR